MKLGFVTAVLPDYSLRQLFSLARDIGYDCIEVMVWPPGTGDRRYAGVTHIDVTQLGPEKVREIQEVSQETGVSMSGLGYYPNLLAPDPEHRRHVETHLRRVIEASAQLGIFQCNTFVGRDWTRTVDDNWSDFMKIWPPLVAFAESHGVRIGIENCPMLFSQDEWPGGKNLAVSPRIWRRMFAEIPSPWWGLNYDPSHLVWQQMDYLRPIQEFGQRIYHVHAKDMRLDRDRLDDVGILAHPHEFHTPKLPGLGEVAWGPFVAQLLDAGYRGAVCVEVEDRAFEGSSELRERSLRQSHQYLRNFIAR